MKLFQLDYSLPKELIALSPLSNRDHSKMLVVKNNSLNDDYFKNIIDYFEAGDLLVFNNSKVIPAKITIKKSSSSINIYLHKQLSENKWQIFAKPGRKLKIAEEIKLNEEIFFKVLEKTIDGQIIIQLSCNKERLFEFLENYGEAPLPPYIEKYHQPNKIDKEKYQTVFARHPGSVAAPTAGLHFTEEILNKLTKKKVNICFVTLHVGGGTFLPIKSENINEHNIHSEYCEVTQETANLINSTISSGKRVVAIGSTAMRTIESCYKDGKVHEFKGETQIYITPGYKFKVFDMMLTNFHLPKSTLLALVSAFAGYENIMQAYQHAINKKYRFFSYGDCCLLYRS